MLVTLKEILKIAEEKSFAIGSFNVANLENLMAITEAAEELNLPVITAFAQPHEELIPLDVIAPIMINYAKKAKVPVCALLDHGADLDYLQRSLDYGFTGIMFDGSVLPYEENARLTKKAVAMAEKYGASVEAELGCMGQRESGLGKVGQIDETKIYTDPELAKKFVDETGIDALACSFGTTHGIYLTAPKLDCDIIARSRQLCGDIPIVMHGGSGVSPEGFQSCIKAGVRKVNYFTYMDKAGGQAADVYLKGLDEKAPRFYSEVRRASLNAMKENVKEAMKIFAFMN